MKRRWCGLGVHGWVLAAAAVLGGAVVACSDSDSGTAAGPAQPDAGPTPPARSDAGATTDSGVTSPDSGVTSEVTRLSVSGKDVLDPSGQPIVLRGWVWGNWGTWQPQDAADNATQGATVVRVPLRWWGDYVDGDDARKDDAPGHIDPAHLKELDDTIDGITSQGLWVDLFFDSNCGQASIEHDTEQACGLGNDGQPANFANAPDMKQKYIELWSFLAEHYAKHPKIAMYELLAEPNMGCGSHGGCTDWSAIPKFYQDVIPAVRAKDPLTPVLVGPGGSYQMKSIATALITGVPNVIYTGDILSGGSANPDSLAPALQFRDAQNVPIFVQQVGVKKSDANATQSLNQTLTALNKAGIGWTWWTYREPHNPMGQGFAPYYKATGATEWSEDAAWLALVAGYFKD